MVSCDYSTTLEQAVWYAEYYPQTKKLGDMNYGYPKS
jgi:hypothetical protein